MEFTVGLVDSVHCIPNSKQIKWDLFEDIQRRISFISDINQLISCSIGSGTSDKAFETLPVIIYVALL